MTKNRGRLEINERINSQTNFIDGNKRRLTETIKSQSVFDNVKKNVNLKQSKVFNNSELVEEDDDKMTELNINKLIYERKMSDLNETK